MSRLPFLAHADVAVEIFKRALLPPVFTSLDSGYDRFIRLAGVT